MSNNGRQILNDLLSLSKTRREQLFQQMSDRSIAVLPGAKLLHRNSDAEYPFRQESNFFYLTSFPEPDSVLVLSKETNRSETILFCQAKNPDQEIWTGPKIGPEGALADYSVNLAFDINELEKHLPKLLENKDKIYYSLGQNPIFDERMISFVNKIRKKTRKGIHAPETWVDFVSMIESLRVYKNQKEIALIRESCRIASEAHVRLMKHCRVGKWEYQLEGEFLHECCQHNARFMAYTPIVASGSNACTLHYIQNDQQLQEGDLLLVDAGCEYYYYASDITRTYPVNGCFTVAQRAIYELVLAAQMAAIEKVRPGVKWHQIQETILVILVKGLVKLGILKGDEKKLIQEQAYLPYYMHSSGHWLGLDVHDAGEYKINDEWRSLEPGMVFTIEPGLYFAKRTAKENGLDKRWWGIAVRIEDDILVTKNGCEVLTEGAPKTIADIEALMGDSAATLMNKPTMNVQ